MEKTVAREIGEKFREQLGGGGVKGGVELGGEFGLERGLRLELGEAERNRALDLLREIKVVAGDVGEERVDEMQPAQVVALAGHFRFFESALTSSTNSATSRNCL